MRGHSLCVALPRIPNIIWAQNLSSKKHHPAGTMGPWNTVLETALWGDTFEGFQPGRTH